jgi:hypothetical protein
MENSFENSCFETGDEAKGTFSSSLQKLIRNSDKFVSCSNPRRFLRR